MKMPITLGEYIEWKELKTRKHLSGQGGTWIIDSDCPIYTHILPFSNIFLESIKLKFDLTMEETAKYVFDSEVTEPLFPHVLWKDVILHEKHGITYIRKWLDPNKARFIEEKIE